MALRSRHGASIPFGPGPVLETLPIDELPDGEPARADDASRQATAERGKFTEGNKRSVIGGRAHKGKPRFVERVSLIPPGDTLPTRRYHVAAKAFVKAAASSIAATVGGGRLDPHAGYFLTAAGRAAKWANYFSDLAERMPEASKEQRDTVAAALAADERASSHLRNAHEYAARSAASRPQGPANYDHLLEQPKEPR
jgi:hypothetical protein